MKKLLAILSLLIGAHAELFFTPQMISTHLQGYSEEELEAIEKDLSVVRGVCLEGSKNTLARFYIATAGAPGARKTTILERFISRNPEYQDGVYLDPDARSLKFMVNTYIARSLNPLVVANHNNYDLVIHKAYDKWRGASQYIALTLLEEAFAKGRSIIHGATSTGGHIPDFFSKLKEHGYEIILLLCSCPDRLRFEAVDFRNREIRFYQSSPEDALSKGLLFPQRLKHFFGYADRLFLFWSDDLFSPERLAGVWSNGELQVHDRDALQSFIDKYEEDRMVLEQQNIAIPPFESYLQKKSPMT